MNAVPPRGVAFPAARSAFPCSSWCASQLTCKDEGNRLFATGDFAGAVAAYTAALTQATTAAESAWPASRENEAPVAAPGVGVGPGCGGGEASATASVPAHPQPSSAPAPPPGPAGPAATVPELSGPALLATLHSNMAACYLKLDDAAAALRHCDEAIALDGSATKVGVLSNCQAQPWKGAFTLLWALGAHPPSPHCVYIRPPYSTHLFCSLLSRPPLASNSTKCTCVRLMSASWRPLPLPSQRKHTSRSCTPPVRACACNVSEQAKYRRAQALERLGRVEEAMTAFRALVATVPSAKEDATRTHNLVNLARLPQAEVNAVLS